MYRYKPSNSDLYKSSYYKSRHLNDQKRIAQFEIDKNFIKKYFSCKGNICDVGCSTGEFLSYLKFDKCNYFGMEINSQAIRQARRFISFKKNIFTEKDFFDLVIFRGTIQHVDEPFNMIKHAYISLKKGGLICFLMTPNSDSILYKLKKNLAILDLKRNFYIPGEYDLQNALNNYGFKILDTKKPYINTPYCSLFMDHFNFIKNLIFKKFYPHPFWGSSIMIMAQK